MSSTPLERITQATRAVDPLIWVITTRAGEQTGGLIATFVTKASIVPDCQRYVIGIAKQHHTWKLLEESNQCVLHLIGPEQRHWLLQLGGQSGHRSPDKLQGIPQITLTTSAPVLEQALVAFDCRVEARLETGDRTVYLLEVVDALCNDLQTPPLRASDLGSVPKLLLR